MMSRHDAELYYDGPIPPGVVDPSAPDRFRQNAGAPAAEGRITKITPKPEFIRDRMAKVVAFYLDRDSFSEADLLRHGFSNVELAQYFQDALRQALFDNPFAMTIERCA